MKTFLPRAIRTLAVAFVVCSLSAGCTRTFWRKQADCETYGAIAQKVRDPRWDLLDYSIYPNPQSRFYDPNSIDYPPMPPDDPTAHRLMHCVDCKSGFPCWHADGDIPIVDSPYWQNYLPLDKQSRLLLDMPGATQLAYLHSRDYQSQLETLYLSALDVTFERFRFDVQFFGGNTTTYTAAGEIFSGRPSGSSVLTTVDNIGFNRLLASGGQLSVELANTIVWQFAGPNTNSDVTLASFSLLQPLIRGASRAVVLERLTLAERTLLYNVRAMYRYQQGFYVQLYTGQAPDAGPQRIGGLLGGVGLQGFTGVGSSGFGRIGNVNTGAGGVATGGGFTGGAGAAEAGGYLGLLQDLVQIQNRQANVNGLRDSLAQLEAAYDAGRIDRFQVDLARQALFNAQSQLLTAKAAFQANLDSFKVLIGLPPTLEVLATDPILRRFELLQPELLTLQSDVGHFLDELRSPDLPPGAPLTDDDLRRVLGLRKQIAARFGVVEEDFKRLDRAIPERLRSLKTLLATSQEEGIEVGPIAYSSEAFESRIAELKRDYGNLTTTFERLNADLLAFGEQNPNEAAPEREQLTTLVTALSSVMEELQLIQARARLDAVTLTDVELDGREAVEIAAENRLDWMNARAGLVDQWRLIQFNATALRSGLNLSVNGDIGTTGNNPVNFHGTNGQLTVGLQFDAPLTRVAERNIYRQALIQYQQSRRAYMQYVDSISQLLRNELRSIRLNQLNFELRRGAVLIAINQVDLTALRLRQPPRPGEDTQFGVTTARDLVDSLGNLLNVQNDFLSVWVNYELQRVNLDYDLGTMMLDQCGVWIDPGAMRGSRDRARAEQREQDLEIERSLEGGETAAAPDDMFIMAVDEASEAAPPALSQHSAVRRSSLSESAAPAGTTY